MVVKEISVSEKKSRASVMVYASNHSIWGSESFCEFKAGLGTY
jgi:hypothetical protein